MASVEKGLSRRIKDAIKSVLVNLQYGGETAFVQVLGSTVGEFESYPSVRVLPSSLNNEDLDSADRQRTTEYAAILHFFLGKTDDVDEAVFDQMYDLTDLIVNALDHADEIRTLSNLDPSIQSSMINVPRSRWYIGQSKAGALLLCNITIQVSYSQFVD